MGIFGRMKTLIKSNVNDLASKAEDPAKILDQLLLDMQEQLSAAKLQVRDTLADQKRLEKQHIEAQHAAQEWEKKAMTAVKAGEDDLAREALARKSHYDEQASAFQSSAEQQKAMVSDLKDSLRALNSKIEEAKRKRNSLVARAQQVEAKQSMATTANAMQGGNAFDEFERHAGKIDEMEYSVQASAELSNSVKDHDLEAKFAKVDSAFGTDDELAALKAKMGMK